MMCLCLVRWRACFLALTIPLLLRIFIITICRLLQQALLVLRGVLALLLGFLFLLVLLVVLVVLMVLVVLVVMSCRFMMCLCLVRWRACFLALTIPLLLRIFIITICRLL